ncbi:iron-hydroxamate ABC transporter substrate-binding protein [Paenibacillus lutimineralis]|uniref:Iron-hydroxamate ABC transporter substrate-binding protein n=1 Tax=Paenibacillus lutimineralis TaxID=2707005 RepID=A0A3Q9IFD9_9BACL|nr:iron-hydroxamate ABC transporter substrate-binding protein [Paenibacillus lutimineralis]AZS17798.1 iron-hydroxamate ABC transporter substrate-binding protein [Paenibacillus lutimineralis]
MKKIFLPIMLLCVLLVSACGNQAPSQNGTKANSNTTANQTEGGSNDTITYQSEDGPIEVPANPKRVIVLSSYTGDVLALGVNLVGVDSWSKMNPNFKDKLENAAEVSDENLEKIIEVNPDLIIGLSNTKNLDKLKEIAPTVTYTYGKLDYLTQILEIGKLLNKEKEAEAWVNDFKQRAEKAGDEIREKIGENATVSVFENFDKQIYVFGDNWARGTEILYQAMKLKMPEKVKETALKDGYYALSLEVLPEYAGDYIILSKNSETDNSFLDTDTYKNIPAVKNDHVFVADAQNFYFNDALTLDYQLDFFIKHFLGK